MIIAQRRRADVHHQQGERADSHGQETEIADGRDQEREWRYLLGAGGNMK